jgi:glucosamine-6-phosphate deaminase
MQIIVSANPNDLGKVAGVAAGNLIRQAIQSTGKANIILATGTSQFGTLNQLISGTGIDWGKVVMFHLDEYIGLPQTSKASFRKYLKERFIDKVPDLKAAHLINGEGNAEEECKRLGELLKAHPIDVALVGLGENGHLAFNDPPADFNTMEPYIIVQLDEACRQQQLGEGWFDSLKDVPRKAISMSIQQILKSRHIICSVPDSRKAIAVKNCIEEPVTNLNPASILQLHPNCSYYLDESSASLLSPGTLEAKSKK